MTSLMLITRCQTLWGDPLESLNAWLSKALQCVLSWLLQVEQLGGETPLQLTVSRSYAVQELCGFTQLCHILWPNTHHSQYSCAEQAELLFL